MVLKVRRTFTARVKTVPLFYSAGRPEAVPYMCALGRIVRVGGDAHIAPPYTHASSFYAAGRPEAIPYIRPLDCIVNCQLSIVNFPQPFTFHL